MESIVGINPRIELCTFRMQNRHSNARLSRSVELGYGLKVVPFNDTMSTALVM
jgi:hypothetical protein